MKYTIFYALILILYTLFSTVYLEPDSPKIIVEAVRNIPSVPSKITTQMKFDSLRHGLAGLGLGILTLDPTLTVLSVSTSVIIDIDHIPHFSGLTVPARVSHSLILLILEIVVLYSLSRDEKIPFVLASSFLCHMALDRFQIPIFSPLSTTILSVRLSTPTLIFTPLINMTIGLRNWDSMRIQVRSLLSRIHRLINGLLTFR